MGSKVLSIIPVLLVLGACQSRQGNRTSMDFEIPDSIEVAADQQISEEALDEIVQNVSSPIEMAALIKEIGSAFSTDYLSTTDFVDKYNTSTKQAYILGVFGADLGYLNINNKNTQVVDYLTSINKLADDLRVGQFFEFNTLKRLATSRDNIDSLMYISVSSFNNMDSYLRENKRGHLSALMITGIWVEGMYLVTQVAKASPNPLLADRIGEQKLNLNNLFLILRAYESQPDVVKLIRDLEVIKTEYDAVEISYELGEPETVEMDGMIMIVQNEKSLVNITDEQLESIIEKTAELRNRLISL